MTDQPPPCVDIVVESPLWNAHDLESLAVAAFGTVLDWAGIESAGTEIVVLACDDSRVSALNAAFRGRPNPTNVLSWPSRDRASGTEGAAPAAPDADDRELGDIAIAYETCAAEARAQGKPFEAHVTHLLVHAILHLLGYDHERDGDAERMEAAETHILARMGLPDPYAAP